MSERKISDEQVLAVLQTPDELVEEEEDSIRLACKFFEGRKLVAVCREINGITLVITVYWFGGYNENNSSDSTNYYKN